MVIHPLEKSNWEPGVERLLNCLNPWLMQHWQSRLVAAIDEPYYLPAQSSEQYHQIQFAHGYFNSALHELAHWCVAGAQRRLLADFGYWYEPDGRSASQQQEFEQVEVKPQAIEWHFAQACGRAFRVSVDNLAGEATDSMPFTRAVCEQANVLQQGLNERTQAIVELLCQEFGQSQKEFKFRV